MSAPRIVLTEPVGEGPTVVLGPSLGTSTVLWRTVIPMLSPHHRVLAWDLPGHGASAPATGPFRIDDLADAVAEAVRRAGADRIRYAGVSLGGAVGLALAARHPDLVAALAVIASGATLSTPEAWAERAALVREQSTSAVVSASAMRWFAPESPAREPETTGLLLHALQDADDESYARCCEALAGYDMREGLAAIRTPTLVVWGEHDTVAPEETARELAAGMPHARVARIEGAAHLPPAEQPAETAALLREFFGRTEEER